MRTVNLRHGTSRRALLRACVTGAGLAASLPLLAACAPVAPTPTTAPASAPPAPAKPTPAAQPATAAPAAPAAPTPTAAAAAAPPAAAKPAEAPTAAPAAKPSAADPLAWLYPPLGEKQVIEPSWAPVKGNTLRFSSDGNIDGLDPHRATSNWTSQTAKNICECLVSRGPDLKFQPWLATSWDMAPSGTEWTFRLRKDVKFHDGSPFNAEAVKVNFDRILDPASKAAPAAGMVPTLSKAEVVDEFTVRFTLKQPSATFLLNLAHPRLAMLSPTALKRLGEDFARQPVGTGPWKFKDWKENLSVTLTRNEDYRWPPPFYRHQDAAFPQEYVVSLVYEPATRLASLKAGEVSYMSITPFRFIPELRNDQRFRMFGVVLPGVANIMTLNTTMPPLDDVRVRRALNHGFDRRPYLDIVTEGLRPPHDSIVSPATWAYNPKVAGMYPYDLAKAKALLEEAGWKPGPDGIRVKDGQRFKISWVGNAKAQGEAWQAQLKTLGVELEILVLETGTWLSAMHANKYPTSNMAWGSPDPSNLRSCYHSSNIGKPTFQWSQYTNPTVDKLLDDAETEIDTTKRAALYQQVQEILMQDAVAVPTSVSTAVSTLNKEHLGGDIWQDGSQMEWLYDAYVKKA
jgi:peptide/nickel transport system substrate-binding protein